ncbi:MAG: ATP-binding cassette domain-containing protein [Candidatus Hatepunaea meridiana]|nr:ATP-binding cassette domain-containing protein [Candidatus Hatepunaea meridiana]
MTNNSSNIPNEPLARVTNLTAAYQDRVVLENVSLDVIPGEILVILGTSGCGKTTLLKHFIGLMKPAEGNVELFGEDWWLLDEPERESIIQRIGVLFQNGALLGSRSMGANVAVPLEQHTNLPDTVIDRVVKMKLRKVGLRGMEKLLPSELSGGMRKRAALARAMALDPPLIFCDEPSAGLDPATTYNLDRLLLDLRDNLGLTMVVVTHETASIRRIADRIAFLDEGKLIFTGPLEDALTTDIEPVSEFFKMAGESVNS